MKLEETSCWGWRTRLRQPRGNDIVVDHYERHDWPVAQAGILEAIGISYSKSSSIEHDLFCRCTGSWRNREWMIKTDIQDLESTSDLWSASL